VARDLELVGIQVFERGGKRRKHGEFVME